MNRRALSHMRVLEFAAHPDDDVIGCGGSIAKYTARGAHVIAVYMTSGESGSLTYPKDEIAALREAEARAAADVLGVAETVFMRNPDGYLEKSEENFPRIIGMIRDFRPHVIYVHADNEPHGDHTATHDMVTEAVFKAEGPWHQEAEGNPWSVPGILAYEVWEALPHPETFEDVTETMDAKLEALRRHESQLAGMPYDEMVEGLNRYRGGLAGTRYAEAFRVIRAQPRQA